MGKKKFGSLDPLGYYVQVRKKTNTKGKKKKGLKSKHALSIKSM
jgi:hypothetical protein